jgi:hypothetical protein
VNDPVRELVRKALRAMAHPPSPEATRLFDDIFGVWQSEPIQKLVAHKHWTAKEDDFQFLVAEKYAEGKAQRSARQRGEKGRAVKRGKREQFELWVYSKRLEHPEEKWDEFHERLSESRKYPEYLRPKDEVISVKALQRIFARVVKSKIAL